MARAIGNMLRILTSTSRAGISFGAHNPSAFAFQQSLERRLGRTAKNMPVADRDGRHYPGYGAVICVATKRRRRCSPDVVGSYLGVSPALRHVGMQATGAS
jgi:hypothetical protein